MSLDNLPDGWLNISIEDIAEVISGGTPTANNPENFIEPPNGIGWLTPADLSGYTNKYIGHGKRDLSEKGYKSSSAKLMPKGSVVFSSRAPIGYVAIASNEISTNQGFKNFVIDENISSEYLYYYLKSIRDLAESLGTGTTFKELSGSTCKKLPFVLPALSEQQEIVRQLDIMLAQVEQIKARLDMIPTILKKFRQSVLADAVSGKLTEEWRNETRVLELASETKEIWLAQRRNNFNEQYPKKKFKEPSLLDDKYMPWDEIPNGWDLVSVSEFAECLDNLRVPIKKDDRNSKEGLYPYFGANGEVDRVDEFIIDDDIVLVTEDETFYGRTKPIAYRYNGKCWVNNHVHVLKAPTKEANDYLCYALMHYHVIPWLTGTTGRAKLSQAALNSLPLLMPPIKEIKVIVTSVNTLLEHAEKIENIVQSAQKRVNLLTQSILAKAFNGELTAEWREQHQDLITGVKSAEALLAKIQAEREASKPVKKTRKKLGT